MTTIAPSTSRTVHPTAPAARPALPSAGTGVLPPAPATPAPARGTSLTPREATRAFRYDVAIVGMGYVGLPTALAFHAAGASVVGIDVSTRRLATIRALEADLVAADRRRLESALHPKDGDQEFHLTANPARLREAAAIIVCVPTPVDHHLVPDLAILAGACAMVTENAGPGQIIILTSTTYAGCTREMLLEPLAARGLVAGDDLHVAFSPERINPGTDDFSQEVVPRVVGGATTACAIAATSVLARYVASIHEVSSLEAAEMTKLLENTFRAVNIAMINEFAEACRGLDVPVMEVVSAASTKPYGFMPFIPGPGVGGHCIPCDPHYLLWQLRRMRINAPVIEQAMVGIAQRPGHTVDRCREVLSNAGRGMPGARILVVGLSYKRDVSDLRESPALEILQTLAEIGAVVGYVDARFEAVDISERLHLEHVADPAAFRADLVVLHTRHTDADLAWCDDTVTVLDTTYQAGDLPNRILL